MNATYLGDGVYVSFDGYQIWLDTRAQFPVNRIALEPEVYRGAFADTSRSCTRMMISAPYSPACGAKRKTSTVICGPHSGEQLM